MHLRHDTAQGVEGLVGVGGQFGLLGRLGPWCAEHQAVFQGVRQRKAQIPFTERMQIGVRVG